MAKKTTTRKVKKSNLVPKRRGLLNVPTGFRVNGSRLKNGGNKK